MWKKKSCGDRLRRVVYDTSILMLLYDGIPVFEEAERVLETLPECIVPSKVVDELKRLASTGGVRKKRAARLALQLIERKGCRVVDVPGDTGDDAVIAYVLEDCEAIPATADRELRRRLREKGLPHIYYKLEKAGLVLER